MLHIHDKPELSSLTSLHLGGRALARVFFDSLDDMEQLPGILRKVGGRPAVLGGGTNILAADGELPLVLVECGFTPVPEMMGQDARGHLLVRVGAGMRLSRLLAWCSRFGLSGLEALAGIPGTLGGAVAGNAGAHGVDMGSVLRRVNVFSPAHGYRKLAWCDVECGYRSFAIPEENRASKTESDNWFVITGVLLAFQPGSTAQIRDTIRSLIAKRVETQPMRSKTAGCVFKNPSAESAQGKTAGLLLDEAGFRGKKRGGVCFSPVHANFLVNESNGTATAALDLIQEAREAVLQRTGVDLQPEVKIWEC